MWDGPEPCRPANAPLTSAFPVSERMDRPVERPRSAERVDDVPERTREDRALFERYRAGDPLAKEALVDRFLPLARQLARRYQRAEEPLDDLVQVASLGLLKAIDRFDADRQI